MALRKIMKYKTDDVLRKKSRPVEKINERTIMLLDDMKETMNSVDGVGLAAPQVGVLRRIFIVDLGENLIEFINPEIVKTEGTYEDIEGCLSVPDQRGRVIRPQKVWVKALNREGKEFEICGEDLMSRAICHEFDHLDGKLFVDKIIPGTVEGVE